MKKSIYFGWLIDFVFFESIGKFDLGVKHDNHLTILSPQLNENVQLGL